MKAFFPLLVSALLGAALPAGATDKLLGPDPSTQPAVMIPGEVARAQFTRAVENLEPLDVVSTLTNDQRRIVYFTEIHGMAGQTVTHRWEYNGKIVLEKTHEVGSSRWRAYTSKTLDPAWVGEWKASVVDAAGGTLSVSTFTYLNKPE